MSDQAAARVQLYEILDRIEFAPRYFAYFEQARDRGRAATPLHPESLRAALTATGLTFKYRAREKFYQHSEKQGDREIGLNVAFPASTVEFILVYKTSAGHGGAPYTLLARDLMTRADPAFTISPPSPKLPFSREQELREAILFGVGLFEEMRAALLLRIP